MKVKITDGGRSDAGYKGTTGDCVTRAISIATGKPYKEVYKSLFKLSRATPRRGVWRKDYDKYLKGLGWEWVPCMFIGSGCRVHLNESELPTGIIIARLSKHICAVIDGVIHDTHDPSRSGSRCVYGYYRKTNTL